MPIASHELREIVFFDAATVGEFGNNGHTVKNRRNFSSYNSLKRWFNEMAAEIAISSHIVSQCCFTHPAPV